MRTYEYNHIQGIKCTLFSSLFCFFSSVRHFLMKTQWMMKYTKKKANNNNNKRFKIKHNFTKSITKQMVHSVYALCAPCGATLLGFLYSFFGSAAIYNSFVEYLLHVVRVSIIYFLNSSHVMHFFNNFFLFS